MTPPGQTNIRTADERGAGRRNFLLHRLIELHSTVLTNGICERFHKTVLQEFYQVTFRKTLYSSIEELQKDLDVWLL